jgi:hypothetical protein
MGTFQERLVQIIGDRGYESCMRRSIQTVILYEAHRCVAFFDQAIALAETTSLLPHQREEIMWRTGTSKEPMQPDTAWKRMKLIEKEVEKLQEKIKPTCGNGKTHDEIVNDHIQQQYVSTTD